MSTNHRFDDEEQLIANDHDDDDYRHRENEDKFEAALRRNHIIYTCALYFCFISIGLCDSIFNPTLVQLSSIFGSDLQHVSLLFPLSSVGSTVGTLTNGFVNAYVNRQTFLFACLIMKALTIFLVPHWTSVGQFCMNGFFNGFFTAAIVVMVNVWLNEQWSLSGRKRQQAEAKRKRKTRHLNNSSTNILSEDNDGQSTGEQSNSKIDLGNVLMQTLHFFYGIGTILGPLLSEPFLPHAYTDRDGFFCNSLVTPFTIASASVLTASIIFFVLFLVCPYEQPNTAKKVEFEDDEAGLLPEASTESSTTNDTSVRLHYLVIFSACLLLFVLLFSEGTYFQFSASFATKTALHMSEPDAALLASSLTISFTTFRALSVLIALKLTPDTMILLDLITVAIGNTLVYFFADHSIPLFALGYILLGAGFASAFPSTFPFLERHGFPVTDMVGSLLTFSGGVTQVLAPLVIGLYIDTAPYVLVYCTYLSLALSFVALFVLNSLIAWIIRQRRPNETIENFSNGLASR